MQFCDEHWTTLREKVEGVGMGELISKDGPTVAKRMEDSIGSKKQTLANFDPLMDCHWAIIHNCMQQVQRGGGDPMELLAIEGCPLCFINKIHEDTCQEDGCTLDKERGFDYMLDYSVRDAHERWERLKEVEVGTESN